jgi:hypothetical protein
MRPTLNLRFDHQAGDIELQRDGETFHDWCHVLINGSGVINKWKCSCTAPLILEWINDFSVQGLQSKAYIASKGS